MASRCASASFASFVASRWRWVAVWLPAPGRVRWLGLGWVPSTFSPDLSFAQRRSPPPPLLSIATHRAPTIRYDSQSISLLSTGIGTAVSQPHPCCHSISLLLLLLVSHSQLSAAASCLLLVVCLSASIPPYSPSRRLGPLR